MLLPHFDKASGNSGKGDMSILGQNVKEADAPSLPQS